VIAATLVLPPRRSAAAGQEEVPRRILGLSLLERSILEAVKAGVARVTVLAGPGEGGLAATLAASPALRRAGVHPVVVEDGKAADALALLPGGHLLLLDRDVVFSAALLADPRVKALAAAESVVFTDGRGGFAGVAVCAPGFARAAAADHERDPVSLADADGNGSGPVSLLDRGEALALVVSSGAEAREARGRLIASVRKATDGFVSRNFNRPISLAMSRLFILMGVTPNMISGLGLAMGLAGAWLVARGDYGPALLGAFLFQVASIVDGSDGEVAKLTYSSSPHGSWIDTACDQVASLAFFAALPIGAWRATGDRVYLTLGVTTLLALAALFGLMIRHVRRFGAHGSMVQILDDFRRAAREPGALGRAARLVSGLSFTVRRDFFAMAFFVLALVDGLRGAVWTIGIAVPTAVLFLAWFSSRLAELESGQGV
jgi:phosphatidylglycerophosphate synthase